MEPTGILLANVSDATVILLGYNTISVCSYIRCVNEIVPAIGEYLAEFIELMGFNLANVEFIGHSLGAHIAGMAGALLDGKLGKITGLMKK